MAITPAQIQAAKAIQDSAAHDPHPQVRLVAGPGTGKSFSIEERVYWLLSQGVPAAGIAVVSFTRASSVDLRTRVRSYCASQNQAGGNDVRVSTLHSLALRILRAAGLLHYPADPLVLDSWELENIFDAEFGHQENIGKKRREAIRREHEAFWNTGQWAPPNYIPPDPPITAPERAAFVTFHGPRTQTYSCVLPGEIIRQCLDHILAGNVDPVALIHLQHLIVDEYQDLNPVDQQFVHEMIARGAVTFVAGDDDQSIYSFRYASPSGIQTFTQQYGGSGSHTLTDCFRCAPSVVASANALLSVYSPPGRLPKTLQSLYTAAAPPIAGVVHCWRFTTALAEASAVAASCQMLINGGMNPRDILILLSNQRELLPGIRTALNDASVPFEPPRQESFVDTETGRFLLAILRIVCDMHDYVAHRLVLGLRAGVGVGTSDAIAESVISNALNYRDIFYQALPTGVFSGRRLTVLTRARQTCATISAWGRADTIAQRTNDISTILTAAFNASEAQNWQIYSSTLPPDMTIEELRDWLWADTDEQQMSVLASIYTRLNQPVPAAAVLPPRVRVMSMHGAKGLSARVVFVPGLEDDIFPGPWRQPYPGLVLEAARLLYVSITRARAACVLTYARRRMMQGVTLNMGASRFTTAIGGTFTPRTGGLQTADVQQILADIAQL
jgi:superfamily I DNA/RNA helicase